MKKPLTYEEAMAQLEQLASQMERNELGIDTLAARLKEAQQLIAQCRTQLTEVDTEIQKVLATEE